MDFHHQLKCAILDAVDEGLIERDPTRKVIIKGRPPKAKKVKYLNQFELHTLLNTLNLEPEINWDWFILLVAKTGMRFSEAIFRVRHYLSARHGIIKVTAVFCLPKISHPYVRYRWTG